MSHRILIVDEQDEERKALDRYLAHDLGYRTTAVASALEAFEAAIQTVFDLAIVSAHLEKVTGIEAYMRLRSITPELQAIFFADAERLSEQDADFLRFSIPAERVIHPAERTHAHLTRLIIGILGPPTQ